MLSDAIVLWRMCVVWDKTRSVYVFAAVSLFTTFGLNVANVVATASFVAAAPIFDKEIVPTYGGTSVGLVTVFVSLTSNLCATMLVAVKVWYAVYCSDSSVQYSCHLIGCIEDKCVSIPSLAIVAPW